jgi:hypothetical protein
MDPDILLAELKLTTSLAYRAVTDDVTDPTILRLRLDELTERVFALDEWLGKGGFLPDAWSRDRTVVSLVKRPKSLDQHADEAIALVS